MQEIKRHAGITPFADRLPLLSNDGFSKCPFHDGDGEKSFHVVQKEDGAFVGTCFSSCGRSWDAIDFVKKYDSVDTGEAIRKLLSQITVHGAAPAAVIKKPSQASPMSVMLWTKSGREVTDADVSILRASRPNSKTPSATTLNKMGFKIAENYGQVFLVSPYRLGDTFYTLKARNLKTKEFIQQHSVSQKGLFNIDAVTAGSDVYIVESELDAAVLHEHGYTAVSVINAKQSQIEPEVLKHLTTKAGRIFIVGDQDAAGQICMDNIKRLLPPEKIHTLSFSEAKDVGELAATLPSGFKEKWDGLTKGALSSWVTHNIPFASDIEAKPMEWVVDRMLPYGGLLLFSGKYGAYKSLWAFFMAAGIEAGTSVFGRKVLRKIPVLYVDRENHQQTVGERRTGIGLPDNAVRYWGDWIENQPTPSLDDEFGRLAEFAIKEKGVIIFDSLTDWLDGANENDPSAMTDIMRKFRRLARLGAGVIVLHHADKYRSGYRGSTAIPAGADMAMKAAKTEDGVLLVREEKFRMCKSWEMDVTFDFKGQYTYQVLRDQGSDDRRKTETADEIGIVRGILTTFHQENDGAGFPKTKLIAAIHGHDITKPRTLEIMAKGVRDKWLRLETSNDKTHAITYHLVGWKPEAAV